MGSFSSSWIVLAAFASECLASICAVTAFRALCFINLWRLVGAVLDNCSLRASFGRWARMIFWAHGLYNVNSSHKYYILMQKYDLVLVYSNI